MSGDGVSVWVGMPSRMEQKVLLAGESGLVDALCAGALLWIATRLLLSLDRFLSQLGCGIAVIAESWGGDPPHLRSLLGACVYIAETGQGH